MRLVAAGLLAVLIGLASISCKDNLVRQEPPGWSGPNGGPGSVQDTATPPTPTVRPFMVEGASTVAYSPSTPVRKSGLGVSRSKGEAVFEHPDVGFYFDYSPLTDSTPRSLGTEPDCITIVELIGPANNIRQRAGADEVRGQTEDSVAWAEGEWQTIAEALRVQLEMIENVYVFVVGVESVPLKDPATDTGPKATDKVWIAIQDWDFGISWNVPLSEWGKKKHLEYNYQLVVGSWNEDPWQANWELGHFLSANSASSIYYRAERTVLEGLPVFERIGIGPRHYGKYGESKWWMFKVSLTTAQ